MKVNPSYFNIFLENNSYHVEFYGVKYTKIVYEKKRLRHLNIIKFLKNVKNYGRIAHFLFLKNEISVLYVLFYNDLRIFFLAYSFSGSHQSQHILLNSYYVTIVVGSSTLQHQIFHFFYSLPTVNK